ncbi:hypothetical protein [Acaryochloris marina]|uniref:hypothetical protein n=1 Tax=Acaryochloris marina TaxID=155978 RepID=UPI001BAE9AB3|nr:hypothetical protein [Acaryochloris marina]QUY45606.1 hypothetical protein I1H34_28055 [Acaryochloris marina S15]
MKKLLPLLILMSIVPAMPAKANPAVNECYNSLIERPEARPESAVVAMTVEHEGSQYHEIRETYKRPQPNPKGTVFIRTDSSGACEKIMSFHEGSYPEISVYKERLGSEVLAKFQQAFRQQQQEQAR